MVLVLVSMVVTRAREVNQGLKTKVYTSPHLLTSVLRLAEAICRLRLSLCVSRVGVDGALRMMDASKCSADRYRKRRRNGLNDGADEVNLHSLI